MYNGLHCFFFAAGALPGIKWFFVYFRFDIRRYFNSWQLGLYFFCASLFACAAQYAVMPDAYKTFWQYMQAEPADKLHAIQLHCFCYSSVLIIFIRKIYFTIFLFLQPAIADGYLMGVSP